MRFKIEGFYVNLSRQIWHISRVYFHKKPWIAPASGLQKAHLMEDTGENVGQK
jgi:hypothetical protein